MKDKWTACWVTGLFALAAIGALGMMLSKPRTKLEISVKAETSAAAETEPETVDTSAYTSVSVSRTIQTSATAAETQPHAETAPPERNLNRASAEDLKRVSGIGDVLAEAIISARNARGGFTSRLQLCEVSGIGENLTERIMAEFEIPDEVFPDEAPPEPGILPEPDQEPAESEAVYYINVYDANAVTREELLTLPDMTEEKADAILKLRGALGSFRGIYEMAFAEGISGEYFEHVLRTHLYVEGDPHSIARPAEP